MLKEMNKTAVSMMISYVILISIGIALSIGVFAFLRAYSNVEPLPECKSETSLILQDYECPGNYINLTIKNNGFFNVSGYTLLVGNNTQRLPIERLSTNEGNQTHGLGAGHFVFINPLKPGAQESNSFMMSGGYDNNISIIQIQPLILSDRGDKIPCENSIITQIIECIYTP